MIEDSFEGSERVSDWVTIPYISRSDLVMGSWARSWTINPEGNIKCVACAAEQASSRNGMPFIHEQHCRLKVDRRQRPWVELKSMLAVVSIAEPQQCPPF